MENKLSFTMENYLEAVYELSKHDDGARLTDIAARLYVAKPTANSAMASLAEKGLVENGRYRRIHLTSAGLQMARRVAKKHEIIRAFFMNTLRIDPIIADNDACAIEHVISDATLEAMQESMAGLKK
jgi:Mn-dependent DtxR family transcriptional regulator